MLYIDNKTAVDISLNSIGKNSSYEDLVKVFGESSAIIGEEGQNGTDILTEIMRYIYPRKKIF